MFLKSRWTFPSSFCLTHKNKKRKIEAAWNRARFALTIVDFTLTIIPSILKPSEDVEVVVSLHRRYRHLVTPFRACSSAVRADGSSFIIFSYKSFRGSVLTWALIISSSWYVLGNVLHETSRRQKMCNLN